MGFSGVEDVGTRAAAGRWAFSRIMGWRGRMVELTLIETGYVAQVRFCYQHTRKVGNTDHDAVDFGATSCADSMCLPTMVSATRRKR